jgi:hypothetical protein
MTARVELLVNGNPITLDKFVAGFIENTVAGMAASLKGVAEVSRLSMDIAGDVVVLSLNGNEVTTTPFVDRIFRSTVYGMVSPLKGVTGTIDRVVINIDK